MDVTQKVSLTAFLNARLDEDERYLNSNRHHLWTERPLREVAAKRAMLAELTRWPFDYRANCNDPIRLFVRLLGSVYSDHPDYDPGWKP